MSGWQLAERLRTIRPELPVLFMSGYPDHNGLPTDSSARLPDAVVLRKPFDTNTLLHQIRRTLDT